MNAMNSTPKRPILAGGNTIRQAEKPSKAHVTIPYGPGSVTHAEHDQIVAENQSLKSEKLRLEDQLAAMCLRLQRLEERLANAGRNLRLKATATVTRK